MGHIHLLTIDPSFLQHPTRLPAAKREVVVLPSALVFSNSNPGSPKKCYLVQPFLTRPPQKKGWNPKKMALFFEKDVIFLSSLRGWKFQVPVIGRSSQWPAGKTDLNDPKLSNVVAPQKAIHGYNVFKKSPCNVGVWKIMSWKISKTFPGSSTAYPTTLNNNDHTFGAGFTKASWHLSRVSPPGWLRETYPWKQLPGLANKKLIFCGKRNCLASSSSSSSSWKKSASFLLFLLLIRNSWFFPRAPRHPSETKHLEDMGRGTKKRKQLRS